MGSRSMAIFDSADAASRQPHRNNKTSPFSAHSDASQRRIFCGFPGHQACDRRPPPFLTLRVGALHVGHDARAVVVRRQLVCRRQSGNKAKIETPPQHSLGTTACEA